jgi:hypothetical protein
MDMRDFFVRVEQTMLARFRETAVIAHAGDRGENREEVLRDFLTAHLPKRYGITKGQVVTKDGQTSHAIDVIIYDALDCPILYEGRTAVVPVEGVYGIIEVKSRLSKPELLDATQKIESFKKLAPRDLSVIATREYVTVHRPSRPFGIALAYELADNSLDSLTNNLQEECARIHDVNFFPNLLVVLGTGLVHHEKADLSIGERTLLLDTDEFVNLILTAHKREAEGEPPLEVFTRLVSDHAGEQTFGKFFVYLQLMLARLRLGAVDIGRYIDPDAPIQVFRES